MRTERVVSRLVVNGLASHSRVNYVAMDMRTQSVDQFKLSTPGNAALVAESIQADFNDLLRIFDRQLVALSGTESVIRPHVEEARTAAERGLQLSKRLITTLNNLSV